MPAVGVITFELRLDDAHSLKDKRHFVKSLKDRLRAKFNVAVAEIDYQDSVAARPGRLRHGVARSGLRRTSAAERGARGRVTAGSAAGGRDDGVAGVSQGGAAAAQILHGGDGIRDRK